MAGYALRGTSCFGHFLAACPWDVPGAAPSRLGAAEQNAAFCPYYPPDRLSDPLCPSRSAAARALSSRLRTITTSGNVLVLARARS
jgi:hypothetical protein